MPTPLTPGKIKQYYADDEINARQYNRGMWNISRDALENNIRVNEASTGPLIGPLMGFIDTVRDDWNTRWREIKRDEQRKAKMAEAEKETAAAIKAGKPPPDLLLATPESNLTRFWRSLQAAIAPITRTQEMSGLGWKWFLEAAGAPKDLAQFVGLAVEATAGFVLTGRSLAQTEASVIGGARAGAKAIGGAVKGVMEKGVKAGKAAEEVATEIAPISQEAAQAQRAFDEAQLLITQKAELEAVGKVPQRPLEKLIFDAKKESAAQAMGGAEEVRRAGHAVGLARAEALPPQTLEGLAMKPAGAMLTQEETIQAHRLFEDPMVLFAENAKRVLEGNTDAMAAFDQSVRNLKRPVDVLQASETMHGRASEINKISPAHELLSELQDIYTGFAPELSAAGNWNAARQK